MAEYDDGGPPPGAGQTWWQGPPPPGYGGQWPPPLPPGGSYGPNFGQIIYPLDANGQPTTGAGPTPGPDPGWGTTPPTPTPTPTPTPAPAGTPPPAAAASDYDYATAIGKIQSAIGRTLSAGEIAQAFAQFGGSASSRFTDSGIAPVIAYFKGAGGGAAPPGGSGVPTSGFGAAPPTYRSDPNAPQYEPMERYQAPIWTGGDYVNPTQAEVEASPGYGARLAAGLQARERSAAAQGTVLNGGTLKALDRDAQTFATNEYQTYRNNTYDAYKQKYSQFQDAAGLDFGARTLNANENNQTFQNRTSTYTGNNSRNLSDFITNITNTRNSELDYWNRLMDVTRNGANAASGSYKP